MAEADGAPRTAGWAPVERVTRSGEPAAAAALEAAVAHEGRVDALTHGFHTYPAGLHPGCAEDLLALTPPGRRMDPVCGGGPTRLYAWLGPTHLYAWLVYFATVQPAVSFHIGCLPRAGCLA